MTRDEILTEIERLSTVPPEPLPYPSVNEIGDRMADVARLADEYMDSERWDNQYVAEALASAIKRLADMVNHYRD